MPQISHSEISHEERIVLERARVLCSNSSAAIN